MAAGAAVALVSRHHRGPAIVAHLVAVVWGGAVTIIIRGDATQAVVAAGARKHAIGALDARLLAV